MSETEIIIKGEMHTSRADLEEERALLKEGVDHLVLEGSRKKNWQFKPSQYWYAWMLLIIEFLFLRLFYVDKTIVEDLAEIHGAEIWYTRDSDVSILENSHALVKIVAAALFFGLLVIAFGIGLAGDVVTGSLLLLLSALIPLFLLRSHESRRSDTGRDIQIAEMIEEAAKDGGRIVVIVGGVHAQRLPKYLSDDLPQPEVRPPKYGFRSWSSIKELCYPTIVVFSVVYVVYSGLLAYVQFFL